MENKFCKNKDEAKVSKSASSVVNVSYSLGIIDMDTFKKILYFWFLTVCNTQQATNMNIDDILIKLAYNYYFWVNTVLLKYYHYDLYHLDYGKSGDEFDRSYLWLIHSNGNVYYIKRCHGLQNTIKTSSMDKEMNERYLQNHRKLSSKQCEKLISILLDLQINVRRTCDVSGDRSGEQDMIIHSGKELAEIYGVASKQYQRVDEINFDPLINFFKNELNIDTEIIEWFLSAKSLKRWIKRLHEDWQELKIRIDHDNNLLDFYKDLVYFRC